MGICPECGEEFGAPLATRYGEMTCPWCDADLSEKDIFAVKKEADDDG